MADVNKTTQQRLRQRVIRELSLIDADCRDGNYEFETVVDFVMAFVKPRSIETAPKDGTYVIALGDSGYITTPLRAHVASYQAEHRPKSPWQTHDGDGFEDSGEPPSLWIPLLW